MTPLVILEIINSLLKITLEMVEGMTPEQKKAVWDRHEKRMDWWERRLDLFDRDEKKEPAK